jgi:hypothetical protein
VAVNWRRASLALTVYVIAALVLTWPLAITLTTRLGALQGPGDPYLNLWILGWGLHAWTTDPASVFSGRVFDANIFFPAEGTLAYSDHFLLQALALSPVYAISGNAVLCYNLLVIGSLALSGLAMHALTRTVTGSTTAAFLAGLAWACWPYRTAHLLHIQLQALYFMPLALLCLHRVVAGRRWRDGLALGAAASLQAIASVYYGIMTAVLLVTASVALGVTTGQWLARRLWSRLIVAAIVALILAVPAALPYMRVQQSEGFGRTLFEAGNHSASWRSYTQVPPDNLVYGRTGLLAPREPAAGERNRRTVEHQMFPGAVLLLLAVAGVVLNLRRDARPLVLSSLAVVVVGGVLSLGPEGARGLYATLHDNAYGFQAIRAPARFAVVAFMGLALLAALGLRAVALRVGMERRRYVGIVLISLLCLEYLNAPLALVAAPPLRTDIGQWLAHEPTAGAVLYLPLGDDIDNTPAMVQSLEHHRPIVNGYSGQRPPFFSALVESLADFPSPNALATIHELDLRFIVAPAVVAGAGDARSPLVERARFTDAVIYEVRWSDEALAALGEVSGPAPPPAGIAPFAVGESLVYEVRWDGGPVDLPAGKAVLTVLDGGPGRDWTFEARADTAEWLSRFFQARDRFVTVADAGLRPLEHQREIREGRRELNRTYLYDRDARHIRIGASREAALAPDAMTLPLGVPDARDALSALYYVRSLPLSPGTIVTVPLNEAGASLQLLVAAAEQEVIQHGGRPMAAIRVEPRLMRRIERRQPLSMTIWLSADGQRVPLRVIVRAGFGQVRAELTQSRDAGRQ